MSKRKKDKEDDHSMTLEEKVLLDIEHEYGMIDRLVEEALDNSAAEKIVAEVMNDELVDEFE